MESTSQSWRHRGLVVRCAAAYFALVFAAGFLLGSVRVPLLVPRLGERWAELVEMPLMFVAIFLAAGHVVRRYGARIDTRDWPLVGVLALALMVIAELLLAGVLADRSVGEYIAGRDTVSGSAYIVMLLVFAAMPWLRRGRGDRHSRGRADEA